MMTRKISFLTVLFALLVLVVGSSFAQRSEIDTSIDSSRLLDGSGEEGGGNGNVLTVSLVVDGGSFDLVPSPGGGGPFYIGGTLFDADTQEELGEFQCWGWFFTAERRMVTQEYNLGDRGTIILVGEELLNPLAIVGGTGDFKNARGEMNIEFTEAGILVHFTLIGAGAGNGNNGEDDG